MWVCLVFMYKDAFIILDVLLHILYLLFTVLRTRKELTSNLVQMPRELTSMNPETSSLQKLLSHGMKFEMWPTMTKRFVHIDICKYTACVRKQQHMYVCIYIKVQHGQYDVYILFTYICLYVHHSCCTFIYVHTLVFQSLLPEIYLRYYLRWQ